jgi:hypothetical protein
MSKQSIARKGSRFIAAHNARVLRATKALTKAQRAASAARLEAAWTHGLFSPEYEVALAAFIVADRAMWAARHKRCFVTMDDRVLISVFNA